MQDFCVGTVDYNLITVGNNVLDCCRSSIVDEELWPLGNIVQDCCISMRDDELFVVGNHI